LIPPTGGAGAADGAYIEFSQLRLVLRDLHDRGIKPLADVRQADLDALVRQWTG
jgi:hypothetical protein